MEPESKHAEHPEHPDLVSCPHCSGTGETLPQFETTDELLKFLCESNKFPWRPGWYYNEAGDMIHVCWKDVAYTVEWLCFTDRDGKKRGAGVELYRTDSGEIVGLNLTGIMGGIFRERISRPNNTTNQVSTGRLEKLWQLLRKNEGLEDWNIKFIAMSDGLCQRSIKRILVGMTGNYETAASLLLHEAAHAMTPPNEDEPATGHSLAWFSIYNRLLYVYLNGATPNKSDLIALGAQQSWKPVEENVV